MGVGRSIDLASFLTRILALGQDVTKECYSGFDSLFLDAPFSRRTDDCLLKTQSLRMLTLV
jgi:hypothetical protein